MALADTLTLLDARSALEMAEAHNAVVEQFEEAKETAIRTRKPATDYSLGDKVIVPGKHNFDKILTCTQAGFTASGALTVNFDTLTVGNAITDGYVIWTCESNTVTVPVTSVNGKTGAVDLGYEDVGAAAADHTHTLVELGAAAADHTHTLVELGAAAADHTHEIADINSLQNTLDGKAPLANPSFTGEPTAPTAPKGTDNTQLATTAFVAAAAAAVALPPGVVLPFAGAGNVPDGYYLCDGSAVSRTDDAGLFAAIGTAYGAGDGSTTFNLPDFRGKFLRGYKANTTAQIGTAQEEGLPSIELAIRMDVIESYGETGVIASYGDEGQSVMISSESDERMVKQTAITANKRAGDLIFGASDIYGNSEHVTPENFAVQYIIKR